jgi:uncharacterized membrane protein
MAALNSPTKAISSHPAIYKIGVADLRDSLSEGLDDFRDMPTHSVFLIAIYPVVGRFALVAVVISVLSFPMLVDRNVSILAAVLTSIKAVSINPETVTFWSFIAASALLIGSLPFFDWPGGGVACVRAFNRAFVS